MIHYTCDLCKRTIEPAKETRYVVQIDVLAAPDAQPAIDEDDDRDYLAELHDLLESATELDDTDESRSFSFDLCPECRKRFLKNPLGADASRQLDFSQN